MKKIILCCLLVLVCCLLKMRSYKETKKPSGDHILVRASHASYVEYEDYRLILQLHLRCHK